MSNPLLSIIVPIYNVEPYLRKCLDSIRNQTLKDFECIMIDDGSPDNCGTICDEYALNDSRFTAIHQENKGVSEARNAGLDVAHGKYIGFIDPDDWVESKMYEIMCETLQKNEHIDITICNICSYAENGDVLGNSLVGLNEEKIIDRDTLLKSLYGMPDPYGGGVVNKCFRSEVAKKVKFRSDIVMAEDWIYLFEVYKLSSMAQTINETFYYVLNRKNSATRKNEIQSIYELLFGGKSLLLLLLLGRGYSEEMDRLATIKYIDDSLRYANRIKCIAKVTNQRYRAIELKILLSVLKQFPRAITKKYMSHEKALKLMGAFTRTII